MHESVRKFFTISSMALVVVGIDLGSSTSELAYAHVDDPEKIHSIHGKRLKAEGLAKPDWWYSMPANFVQGIPVNCEQEVPEKKSVWSRLAAKLRKPEVTAPCGTIGVERDDLNCGISEYLEKITRFTMEELHSRYEGDITKREVQWFLTVPAVWDDYSHYAMQKMVDCAQRAGMVTGQSCPKHLAYSASRHPLVIVPETDAAFVYFTPLATFELQRGPKEVQELMVVDLGGASMVDIVVQRYLRQDFESVHYIEPLIRNMRVNIGRTFYSRLRWTSSLDVRFFSYIAKRCSVGCFPQDGDRSIASILRQWERIMCSYDGTPTWTRTLKLSSAKPSTAASGSGGMRNLQPRIRITSEDMKSILDPAVWRLMDFLETSYMPLGYLKALIVMGRFSACPYVMQKICARFGSKVRMIINSSNSPRVKCQGAVILGAYRAARRRT